jgi:hypothetical protein
MLFAFGAANAQDSKTDDVTYQASEMFESYSLAADMIRYGMDYNQPFALISAAEILMRYQQGSEDFIEGSESGPGEKGTKESSKITFSANELLEMASQYDEEGLYTEAIASVKKLDAPGTRGRVNGATCVDRTVNSDSYYTDYANFRGGELAEIAVYGDGDTDLDVYIYDENGNLISKDTGYEYDAYVYWRPKWTGRFYIKVVNNGTVYNDYLLCTN